MQSYTERPVSDDPVFRDIDPDGKDHAFRDAAVRAELEIGEVEETESAAWHHAIVRLVRMTLGFVILSLGVAMMVLPGPGTVVMAAGLVVLSRDIAWADRALRYLRKKTPGLEEDGPIPKTTIVVSLMLMVAAGLATWWWMNGGNDSVGDWLG